MKRYLALLLILLPVCSFAQSADDSHIQAAFELAHRKMWTMAIEEAKAGHSPILAKYFIWSYLKDPESDATFREISSFLDDNPDWPDQPALLRHAEVAIMSDNTTDAQLNAWFAKHPPQTGYVRRMGARSKDELIAMIRDAWVNDEYSKDAEMKILARYHSVLRAEDHIRRIDRLLWEGRDDEAKRLLKYAPYDYQRLFQARLSLAQDKGRAPVDVVNVSPELQNDAGLFYERIKWRLRRDDKDGVRELLLAAPEEVPYPEKWWALRDRQIREALGEGNAKLAIELLANHQQKPGSLSYKEAKWLEGWIALEIARKPERAYAIFSKLYKEAETPAGKARVAYWTGRAAASSGRSADSWYEDAARYPTTFYGQMATWEEDHDARLHIHAELEPSSAEKERFRRRELVQLVYALGRANQTDLAAKFILYLVDDAESPGEAVLAMRLGHDIGRIDFSVRASKKALNSDIVSLVSGWPLIHFGQPEGVETPLLLALSRQESEFYTYAVSPSGAVGLMQLLPGTAKEVAHKNDIPYAFDQLYNPDYNMQLGSLYLRKMLDHFDGSYVLAIASYNAGPGRVGHWLNEYGSQGGTAHEVLDWIERIPTTETRNYVQHVIANMEVYRYVIASRSGRLEIDEDLKR